MADTMASRISGTWHNQLGSEMELRVTDDGVIAGTFRSPVGGAAGEHPVVGSFEPIGEKGTVLGFVVRWDSARSVTAWSGSYDPNNETISALWLLTDGIEGGDVWQCTKIGHDVFTRDVGRRSGGHSSSVPEALASGEGP
jgi:avidin family protein